MSFPGYIMYLFQTIPRVLVFPVSRSTFQQKGVWNPFQGHYFEGGIGYMVLEPSLWNFAWFWIWGVHFYDLAPEIGGFFCLSLHWETFLLSRREPSCRFNQDDPRTFFQDGILALFRHFSWQAYWNSCWKNLGIHFGLPFCLHTHYLTTQRLSTSIQETEK